MVRRISLKRRNFLLNIFLVILGFIFGFEVNSNREFKRSYWDLDLLNGKEAQDFITLKPSGKDDSNVLKEFIKKYKKVKLGNGQFKFGNIELSDNCIIKGNPSADVTFIGSPGLPMFYTIGKKNVVIEGIIANGNNIDLYGLGLITFINSQHCKALNNKLFNIFRKSDGGSAGIAIEGSSNCKVIRNNITNSGYGIVCGTRNNDDLLNVGSKKIGLNNSDDNTIDENEIDTTTMDGIFLSASLNSAPTQKEINNNKIRWNKVMNSNDLGIESSRNSNNCLIEGNEVGYSAGANIFVRGGDKNKVLRNLSYGAKGTSNSNYGGGIAISEDFGKISECLIEGNISYSNIGDGIFIGISEGIKVKNNTCYDNGNDGIKLAINAHKALLTNNETHNNVKNGISTSAGIKNNSQHTIRQNTAYDNNTGIFVDGEMNIIKLNDVRNNLVNGIKFSASSTCNYNVIEVNDCSDNTFPLVKPINGTGNVMKNNDGIES